MSFKDLISQEQILKAIQDAGYTSPTAIQMEAIPKILSNADLRASSQTGSGKTAAFILPALCRLSTPSAKPPKGPRVLILVPTRELAMQVATESTKYSKYLPNVKTICIYGGTPYPKQIKDLARPHDILVATPGRLIDHFEQGRISFARLEMLILDEADRMLDMGFIGPVEQIADATPKTRQTLMFSATLKGSVLNLSKRLLKDPLEINIVQDLDQHENIEQRLHNVDNLEHKHRLLDHLINEPSVNQAIVFTATKRQAKTLMDKLAKDGYPVATLHGNMNQKQRTRTIAQMHQGKVRILVATDVAARGIDIQAVSHVINFDMPNSAEDYVHRIGRTGRAGASGIALSFVAPKDIGLVRQIERFTGKQMTPHTIPGLEPKGRAATEPRDKTKKPANRSFGNKSFGNKPFGSKPFGNKFGGPKSKSKFKRKPY